MNDDHHELRRISVSVIFMMAFAVAAIIARDAGFGRVGLVLMAGCIASFVSSLATFSRFLQRHRDSEDNG
ncbi:MAG: hypothetical protein AAGI88_15060 [Pseudomonadota bacterium]